MAAKSGTLWPDWLILFVLMLNLHCCVQLVCNLKNEKINFFLISLTMFTCSFSEKIQIDNATVKLHLLCLLGGLHE